MRLIDAEFLIGFLHNQTFIDGDDRSLVYKWIEEQPTIEAEPVRLGRWIPVTNGRGGHECDQCHNYAPSYQTGEEHLSDFCPNCGTEMDTDHIADDSKKVGGAENGLN